MRVSVASQLPLICPACRRQEGDALSLHTLSAAADVATVVDGELVCDNPECRRRYPVVDGVPLIREPADAAAALAADSTLPAATAELLAAGLPDDEPLSRLLEHLSIYLDAHWGERSLPALGADDSDASALWAKIAARASSPVARAVELGASCGRGVAELCRGAEFVVAVDLHLGALRRARRLLDGETVAWSRRHIGRHYTTARASAGGLASKRAVFVAADALDPPLAPGAFDRVVAFNVVDSVRRPLDLLRVATSLVAPGGELLLASPFAWSSAVVEESHRFGGADPAAALPALLGADFTVEETAELPWRLRRDSRSHTFYRCHYVRLIRA